MGRHTKSNVPQSALRWTVERAVVVRLTTATLRKALSKDSAALDKDGLFTTAQVAAAIYGGLHIEKLKTQCEITKKLALENAVTTGSVLNRAEVAKGLAAIADAFVSRLMAAQEIPRLVKEDLLKDLSSWPLVLEEVAHAQSRLPNSKGPREATRFRISLALFFVQLLSQHRMLQFGLGNAARDANHAA